jgi:glycosyltransferase involved in cell wall biosynthesis
VGRPRQLRREPFRIAQVNAAYDTRAAHALDLLDRYPTLREWSEALQAAGARVTTVQRFQHAARHIRLGADYVFVRDGLPAVLPWWRASRDVVHAVRDARPDVVHVNGLQFPALVRALRAGLDRHLPIVVQDHASRAPARRVAFDPVLRWYWRRGLAAADAWSFTALPQATPWRAAGILGDQEVLEILEASTSIVPIARDEARRATGMRGSPAIVWVGRLTANKDPMTVLDGLERALPELPESRVCFVYAEGDLEDRVDARVQGSSILRGRVDLIGRVPPDRMAAIFSAADVYVSGSHREGSGYALLEAIRCGLAPAVTDIPSFRAIAGPHGFFWTPGDPVSCAEAVRRAADAAWSGRMERLSHFTSELSWSAVAARTLAAYRTLARGHAQRAAPA